MNIEIHTADQLATLIESDPWMMEALRAVARQGLRDPWVVAGFVRAKVWDTLHGYEERTPIGDVDVVFFDPSLPPEQDRRIEETLRAEAPDYPWEVYNQAHMHEFNGNAPYTSTVDSFRRWAETVSTVGVRLGPEGKVEIVAPHGIDDLLGMTIRLTPHPDAPRDVFEERLRTKGWLESWPRARVVRPDS